MSHPLRFLPLALVGLAPSGVAPRFAPAEGTEVVKTLSDHLDLSLDDLTVTINGQDLTSMMGDLEFTLTQQQDVEVTDAYDSVGDGRPLRLTRTFDELGSTTTISATADGQGQDQDLEGESELQGLSVVFTWDPDAEEYDIAFEDDAGDQDLLEGLEEDMDLRALLPPNEVSDGDTWEVDLRALHGLASPGGNLKIVPREGAENADAFREALGGDFSEGLADAFEGTCTCTLVGVSESDGARLAEISVEIEASATYDFSEVLLTVFDAMAKESGEEMPDVSVDSADLSVDVDSTATLLWDLDASRVHSFEALGDVELAVDLSLFLEIPGQEVSAEGAAELSGSFTKTLQAEE